MIAWIVTIWIIWSIAGIYVVIKNLGNKYGKTKWWENILMPAALPYAFLLGIILVWIPDTYNKVLRKGKV